MDKKDVLEYALQYLRSNPVQSSNEYKVTDWHVTDWDFVEIIDAVLDRWLTEGDRAKEFRKKLADVSDVRYSVLVNSGSSANLLAVTAAKDFWYSKPGDKVITCATAFPTTVAPIIQNGLVPLFIDINPETLTYDVDMILELLDRDDVCGVLLAHNLGFPHQADLISEKCMELDKWYIADCCDALGTTLGGLPVGRLADFTTYSFFPAHHITTGEGGSVQTDDPRLFRLLQQYSNWGRDCWCLPGEADTCNQRFSKTFGTGLPFGYDHKYVFTKVGYNLKMTELQAAMGNSQIEKLPNFLVKRRSNYSKLYEITKPYDLYLKILDLPNGCSPFGFPMIASSPWVRKGFVEYLEKNNIRTRPLFSGNILNHPMMQGIDYEIAVPVDGSELVMERMFWIGCHPSVTDENLDMWKDALEGYF